ncbi:MAG: hypothetical protein H0X24_19145 [Ktedonobacterales bacterium]|nr:hypothetical protein [Ktedonobacterales bacterium]
MAHGVGSWSWSQRTGGALSTADQRALMAQAVQVQWRRLAKRILPVWGKGTASITDASFIIPDTQVALRAASACAQVSPLWLQHHCSRAYVWATLLAKHADLRYDAELLYVAAMLHDLGLTATYARSDATAHCFGVVGARATNALAVAAQWTEARQAALFDAISLHLNISVAINQGVEAHLLHAGTSYDVIGTNHRKISPAARLHIIENYPRLNFKQEITTSLREQSVLHPNSRAAFLERRFAFSQRIANAPFHE